MRGTHTSEFWMAITVVICASALCVAGKISPDQWIAVATAAGGFYTTSRTVVKATAARTAIKAARTRTK